MSHMTQCVISKVVLLIQYQFVLPLLRNSLILRDISQREKWVILGMKCSILCWFCVVILLHFYTDRRDVMTVRLTALFQRNVLPTS